jgi:RNA 3'-terminal phosphate cyclase (ATP)
MLEIDASYGEGGGQILRSALTLSAVTGKAVRLFNSRANRSKPGLRPQHILAVRAAGQVCHASVTGDALNSSDVTFEPQSDPASGNFHLNVSDSSLRSASGCPRRRWRRAPAEIWVRIIVREPLQTLTSVTSWCCR